MLIDGVGNDTPPMELAFPPAPAAPPPPPNKPLSAAVAAAAACRVALLTVASPPQPPAPPRPKSAPPFPPFHRRYPRRRWYPSGDGNGVAAGAAIADEPGVAARAAKAPAPPLPNNSPPLPPAQLEVQFGSISRASRPLPMSEPPGPTKFSGSRASKLPVKPAVVPTPAPNTEPSPPPNSSEPPSVTWQKMSDGAHGAAFAVPVLSPLSEPAAWRSTAGERRTDDGAARGPLGRVASGAACFGFAARSAGGT